MALVSTLVKRPVTVFIIFIILMGFGIFVSLSLNVELLPNVEIPFVYVSTSYGSAGPQEIEDVITKPVEGAILRTKNIKKMSSISSEGHSGIEIEFNYGTSLKENVNNIRDKLHGIASILPKGATTPQIYQYKPSSIPVVELAVSGNRSSDEVRQVLEDGLKTVFEDVDGVAAVSFYGGQVSKVFVDVSLYKLKEFGISLSDVEGAIATRSIKRSLGSINGDLQKIELFLNAKYKNVEELRSTIVAKITEADKSISHIRLQDVAQVYKGYDKETSQYRFLGDKQVVMVIFQKRSGENIVKVSDNIINSIEHFKRNAPPDFEFTVVRDNSQYVRQNLRNISTAIISGGILAIIVLIIFLRNLASVFVIAIAIPSAVVITLMIMYFLNTSLNIMTLAGLALGIGMLVDNAIVVLENIYTKRMNGVRLLAASEFGAVEMTRSILASTLTTIMVFLPMILFKSQLGYIVAFFLNLSLVVVTSLIASFVIAAFLVPVMTSNYIPIHPLHHKGLMKKFDQLFEGIIGSISRVYIRMMKYMMPRRKRFIALIFSLSLIIPIFFGRGLDFQIMPYFKQRNFDIYFDFPSGTKADAVLATLRDAHAKMQPRIPDLNFFLITASAGSGNISYTLNKAIDAKDIYAIKKDLAPLIRGYTGVETSIRPRQGGGGGGGGGTSMGMGPRVSLELKASNYQALLDTAELFKRTLENSPNFDEVTSNANLSDNVQYSLQIDTGKAELYGVSIASISQAVSNAMYGSSAAKFEDGAKERDISLGLRKEDREQLDILNQLDVKNAKGALVPISNFITLIPSKSVSSIHRKDGKRAISLTATMPITMNLSDGVAKAEALLRSVPKNAGVTYALSGQYKEQQKNIRTMLSIIIIAIVFVFGVMASQFESLLDPFIIMFTIPLTLSGVFTLHKIIELALSAFSLVGIVVLIGVAVNHGIVMVDYMNLLRKRDIPLFDAVVQGASSRLLPILMTSCTTIFGLFPTAFFNFAGSELIRPIATTIVGGLSSSVLLSLLLVPLLYYSFSRIEEKRAQKKAQKKAAVGDTPTPPRIQ